MELVLFGMLVGTNELGATLVAEMPSLGCNHGFVAIANDPLNSC